MSILSKFTSDFKNKKVVIMGLGMQGRGVGDALFFAQIGAKVLVTDLKTEKELASSLKALRKHKVKFVLGEHREKDFLQADLILKNAAVPSNSSYLKLARKKGIRIEMDEALFAQYASQVKLIGITGTRGKSTVTTLIFNILKKAGLRVWLGGNIRGMATLPLLAQVLPGDLVVLELSSWQLEGFAQNKISPQISLITSIFEDHLNRYDSMSAYIEDKKAIFKYQQKKDILLLNQQFPELEEMGRQARSKVVFFSDKDLPPNLKLRLKGEHNKTNALAALKVADLFKVDRRVSVKVLEDFPGLPYRLETRRILNGVEYVNDSTSTTPAAGLAALKSFSKPLVVIAGGSSKNLDMTEFVKVMAQAENIKKIILLKGEETVNLVKLLVKFGAKDKVVKTFSKMKEAVLEAKKVSKPGDIVLLSPGCASFGMFVNEYDRGDKFNKAVASL